MHAAADGFLFTQSTFIAIERCDHCEAEPRFLWPKKLWIGSWHKVNFLSDKTGRNQHKYLETSSEHTETKQNANGWKVFHSGLIVHWKETTLPRSVKQCVFLDVLCGGGNGSTTLCQLQSQVTPRASCSDSDHSGHIHIELDWILQSGQKIAFKHYNVFNF